MTLRSNRDAFFISFGLINIFFESNELCPKTIGPKEHMESDEEDSYNPGVQQQGDGTPSRTFSLDNLPAEFVAFLAKNEIDPAIYTVTDLPRYVRLNPDPHLTITPEELEKQLGTKVEPVPGLEAFCRLDGQAKLRNTQA